MNGEAAIRALGGRLPAVAARNGMSTSEFARTLREDLTYHVGRFGQLLVVDPVPGEIEAVVADGSPVLDDHDVSEVFALHSRPGSTRTIFLDFDGHDASGTYWDDGRDMNADPFDIDGDPSTFSVAERTLIIDVWARVAEDYAPFDVDVTTQDPGFDAIRRTDTSDLRYGTRAVITGDTSVYDCSCGGVAYVGTFDSTGSSHDRAQPAWVFASRLGNGARNIAEATSHEIGHNLGLAHDGKDSSAYYQGHGDWAPIMGVGYYRSITQFSRGEYTGATTTQDDLRIIHANGLGYLADDHGDGPSGATPVSGMVTLDGVIGTGAVGVVDVDAFSFTTAGGDASFTVSPRSVGANLDVALALLDGSGAVIATADPSSAPSTSSTQSGLDATLSATLPAGSYTLLVRGTGFGDLSFDGYSAYGSLGNYRLVGLVPAGGTTEPPPPPPPPALQPPAAPSGVVATASGGTVSVRWIDNATNEAGFVVVREVLHKSGQWRGATVVATTGADQVSVSDLPGSGTYRYSVRAFNAAGDSATVHAPAVTVSGSSGGGGGKGGGRK